MVRAIINFSLLLKEYMIEVALSTGELAKASPNKAAHQAKLFPDYLYQIICTLAPITHNDKYSFFSHNVWSILTSWLSAPYTKDTPNFIYFNFLNICPPLNFHSCFLLKSSIISGIMYVWVCYVKLYKALSWGKGSNILV